MSETSEQYRDRLAGYVGQRDPMKILQETPALLRRLIVRKSPALLARRPQPEKWSVREILSHLADDELVLGYRLRMVLANPGCAIEGFDQAQWAKVLRYSSIEPARSVARFREIRQWNLDLMSRLSPEEWQRYGVHAERGRETPRDMALLYAGHDLNHAAQIRRIVSPAAALPATERKAS
jgi:hypothetical protein